MNRVAAYVCLKLSQGLAPCHVRDIGQAKDLPEIYIIGGRLVRFYYHHNPQKNIKSITACLSLSPLASRQVFVDYKRGDAHFGKSIHNSHLEYYVGFHK